MSSIAASSTRHSGARRSGDGHVRRTRLEITRRGRIVLSALIFLIVLLAAAIAFVALGGSAAIASWGDGPDTVAVTVQPGETLWSYAERYRPEGMDVRDYVLEIQELNGLANGQVDAGQSLELPVHASGR